MKSDFQRKVYSVSQIAAEIRDMIERKFLDIWVEGEISNFKASTAGHLYFTLKDDKAQLSAVCFRNAARLLRFRPENGKTFRARGRITTYEARGEYQLIVEVLEPVGLGALQFAFDQLKEKLQKEGLFRSGTETPDPRTAAEGRNRHIADQRGASRHPYRSQTTTQCGKCPDLSLRGSGSRGITAGDGRHRLSQPALRTLT